MNKICTFCKNPFMQKKNTAGKYCSRKCYWADMAHFKGDKSSGWRGGISHHGPYIMIYSPNHPCKDHKGYVFEHRLIMEKFVGRYLTRNEVIHHIDGNRSNNLIENLRLMGRGEHASEHHKGAKRSPESCARIKLINIGRVRSAETRRRIGLAGMGRFVSTETRLKRSNSMKASWRKRRSQL